MRNKAIILLSLFIPFVVHSANINENFEKRMLKEYTGQAKIKQKNDSIDRQFNSDNGHYFLSSYKQNYLLPISLSSGYNENYWNEEGSMKDVEAAFQVSVKYPLALDVTPVGGDIYITYTSKTNWQVYSDDQPVRETSHEPEILIDFGQDWEFGEIQNTNILLGLSQKTNGRSGGEERAWNRAFADFIFAHKDFSLSARAWIPFSEETGDTNKDMSDYLGYHELNGRYYWQDQTFSAKTSWAFGEGHHSVTLGWSKPLTKAFSVYLEGFYGYGDTLVDFDNKTERISIGFIFTNDLF